MSETVTAPADKFQSRDDLVQYIEQQTTTALDKALGGVRVERRVPWATSGPVGRDSAGYSVLKAAAFALGYLGPDQAKEELQVHQQLRDLYQGYGSFSRTVSMISWAIRVFAGCFMHGICTVSFLGG